MTAAVLEAELQSAVEGLRGIQSGESFSSFPRDARVKLTRSTETSDVVMFPTSVITTLQTFKRTSARDSNCRSSSTRMRWF